MRLYHATKFALAVAVVAGLNSTAIAADVPHKEHTEGQLTLHIDPTATTAGRQEFIATGNGTHIGKYTQEGGHDFYPDGTLVGTFASTASDGATVSGIYFGSFAPIGGTLFQFDVTAVWLEGTGRLEGVTGVGNVIAVLDAATGEIHYDTDGEWTLP